MRSMLKKSSKLGWNEKVDERGLSTSMFGDIEDVVDDE